MLEWHLPVYNELIKRWQNSNLPHALLFSGESGTGKEGVASAFAQMLLCRTPVSSSLPPVLQSCGHCQSCCLFKAMTHPDFYAVGLELQNEQEAKNIKIDQIRELCQRLTLKSQNGGLKIAIINPAERMNHNAANGLLKTLEEPAADTLIMLVTGYPARLLPTVRSRCQKIAFATPSREVLLAHLSGRYPDLNAEKLLLTGLHQTTAETAEKAGEQLNRRDAFLRSLTNLAARKQDVAEVAEDCADHMPEASLLWFCAWVQDMIRIKAAADLVHVVNVDFKSDLQEQANRVDLRQLFDFYIELNKARSIITGSINVSLLLESVFFSWSALFVQMKKRV